MSYSLVLTDIGFTKLAAAISGGPKVNFNEMIFSSELPVYTGPAPGTTTTISYAIYSGGGFVPGFKGWVIQISGGSYSPWSDGDFNGLYVENFPGLPDGYYPATYSSDQNALLVPFIDPTIQDGSTDFGGSVSGLVVTIDPNAPIPEEVARASVADVSSVENIATVSTTVPGDLGGFFIRSVYLNDIDSDIIAAAEFPETYKPSGFGGASTLTINAKINLLGVEDAVIGFEGGASVAIRWDEAQDLLPEQHQQALANIGLVGDDGGVKILFDSTGKPWLGIKNLTTGDFSAIATTGTGAGEQFAIVTLP